MAECIKLTTYLGEIQIDHVWINGSCVYTHFTKLRITQTTSYDSPGSLVFVAKNVGEIQMDQLNSTQLNSTSHLVRWITRNGIARNADGCVKIGLFLTNISLYVNNGGNTDIFITQNNHMQFLCTLSNGAGPSVTLRPNYPHTFILGTVFITQIEIMPEMSDLITRCVGGLVSQTYASNAVISVRWKIQLTEHLPCKYACYRISPSFDIFSHLPAIGYDHSGVGCCCCSLPVASQGVDTGRA